MAEMLTGEISCRTAVHSVSFHFFQLKSITQCVEHTVTHRRDIRFGTDEEFFVQFCKDGMLITEWL